MSLNIRPSQKEKVIYRTRTDCRFCGSKSLVRVWNFGKTPLANAYVSPEERAEVQPLVPLEVYHCTDCHLVQLRDVVDPEVLFSHYLYVSSTSSSFREHFNQYAQSVINKLSLAQNSFVVDIGSNDGILLKPFQEKGLRVLGIDPAENIAKETTRQGIETKATFFTPAIAQDVAQEYGQAQVITANNVFAHTDAVNEFVEAVKILLDKNGVYIFEVQYLGDLVEKNLFDIVYHEHICYYHVTPLMRFFEKHTMNIFDVERVSAHGGSIRVFVQPNSGVHQKTKQLIDLLAQEEIHGLNTLDTYFKFAERIKQNKMILKNLLTKLKSEGKRIVGYGAPAKATTLLYTFDIDQAVLEYIVDDDSRIKQGLYMPGSHIPIVSPEKLYEDKPDYCLILAWNFAEPIMKNHQRFTEQGGQFIIPVPQPKILS